MLNFYLVQKRFEEQIYDIFLYELQYYTDEIAIQNFVERFDEYLELFYSKYKIEWKMVKSAYGSITIHIEFEYDPPFGFDFDIDLDLLKRLKLSID